MSPHISRTHEFSEIYSSVRSSVPGMAGDDILGGGATSTQKKKTSQFHAYATALTGDLNKTMGKLGQLTQLAQSKSLFNDPTAQIEELTYIIKQDLGMLQARLEDLQNFVQADRSASAQKHVHSENVVSSIKSSLMDTTREFQTVLQKRTESMRQQESRRSRFTHSGGSSAAGGTALSPVQSAPHHTSQKLSARKPTHHGSGASGDIEDQPGSHDQAAQQQLVVHQPGVNADQMYYHSRAEAMRSIESTISELGVMFSQLASMVAEQQHTVERIDRDVEDTLANVEAGQNELMKYLKNISSNRMLIMKIFAVLLFFIIFWVIFVV